VFGELIALRGDLAHSLENSGVMVALAALVAYPRGHVLNDNQRFPMPEVFTSALRCQAAGAAARASLTFHISRFFTFHKS
jgi:drug/metabolite transporter (DMT)-like permease